ncbi:MAG: PAS domain S-box protein, partial [Chthoniobacteraceae bacterium]
MTQLEPRHDENSASAINETLSKATAGGGQADEIFRLIVEATPNAIVLADALGRILLVNAGAEKLFGYTRWEMIAQPVEMLVPERFRAAHPGFRTAYAGHAEARLMGQGRDLFALRKDGSEVPVEIGLNPIETADGALILSAIIDITERKRAEEAQVRLAAIVNSSDDAIIGKTLHGVITTWNPGAERIFGYAAAEIIGQPMTHLFPPDRLAEESEILAQITQGKSVEHFETLRIRKDGTRIEISATISPIADGNGKIIGVSKIARDITAHKRVQEALRESEKSLREVTESLPQLIWTCAADGRCDYLSRQWVEYTGVPEQEQLGFGWAEQIHPDDRAHVVEVWGESLHHGTPYDVEFRIRRADGKYRWFTNRAVPLRDGSGAVRKWFGSSTDVDDLKQAEEEIRVLNTELEQRVVERTAQLEAANKELEAFSYSVSHDLRAPLRAVDGFSQAVIEDYGPQLPKEGQQYLQTIREGAQRMGALIDDLLTFSRLSRAPLNKGEVDTGKLVRETLDELAYARAGRQIDLRVGELPRCRGDSALLRQVWVNLISNAFKYSASRKPA